MQCRARPRCTVPRRPGLAVKGRFRRRSGPVGIAPILLTQRTTCRRSPEPPSVDGGGHPGGGRESLLQVLGRVSLLRWEALAAVALGHDEHPIAEPAPRQGGVAGLASEVLAPDQGDVAGRALGLVDSAGRISPSLRPTACWSSSLRSPVSGRVRSPPYELGASTCGHAPSMWRARHRPSGASGSRASRRREPAGGRCS